jgi:hypothetical protein
MPHISKYHIGWRYIQLCGVKHKELSHSQRTHLKNVAARQHASFPAALQDPFAFKFLSPHTIQPAWMMTMS